uniref:ATP-dependent DNA helicase n=3 Tax=Caenorhabditis japonica TaxID=281687 RepID=A0A8R1I5S2_CAEJA
MRTIFNHVFGSTKLNRPQEELNQGVQIAVCNSLATTPSDTDCKRYELIIKCSHQSVVQLVFTFNNFFLLLLRRKSYKYLLSAHQNDQTRPAEEFMRRKRQSETPEESAIRKKEDRESRRLRRADSTEKEKMMERISNSQSKLKKRLLKEHLKPRSNTLRDSHTIQPDIGIKRMRRMQQRPKTHLEVGDSSDADNFQSNIRQFNSALALASMGAQVEEFRDYGPYSYKIHEQIYLAAGPLHPSTEKALSYGQLYTMDTKQAAEERRSVAPNKNLADQERAGKDLEGIKDFRKLTYIQGCQNGPAAGPRPRKLSAGRRPASRAPAYIEMPECFTFDKTRGEWKTRKRVGEWTIRRIYGVSPKDPERYALRLLLLYTKSATSFSDLKTTKDDNGIPTVHDTFVEAAKAQGLLSDDAVVINSAESSLLCYSGLIRNWRHPNFVEYLHEGHVSGFSESGTRSGGIRSTRDYDIDESLVRLGKSIDTFTTAPTIVIDNSTDDFVDLDFHLGRRTQRDPSHALINEQERTVYRLDRNCQHIALKWQDFCVTVQTENWKRFKDEQPQQRKLLISCFETCPTLPSFSCQILPVIRRGTKTDLINNCIKNSYLWNQFQKFSLLDNMRIINGDANWIKFLLDVGDGVANYYEDRVTLLEGLPVLEDLVDDVFGGSNKGKDTFVPRITCYEDKNLPFHLKRTQFPVKLAFAISINKAQGQSFGRVGLYLPEDVFAHGQTYVALSRARSKNELLIKYTSERLLNVVYKEIL